jgi:hypothetical protein
VSCISFITALKKFDEEFGPIQRSALYSWGANAVPVYAISDELYTYAGLTTLEGVKTGRDLKFKTSSPLINDLIKQALPKISTPLVGFINSDIIILEDFADKIAQIVLKYGPDIFMTGTRYQIKLPYEVDSPESYARIQGEERRIYDEMSSADIFIASKEFYAKMADAMPNFIMGRYAWDNWIHTYAEINIKEKYNCTKVLPTLHCVHSIEHIERQEGLPGRRAPSAVHNIRLYEGTFLRYGSSRINKWPYVEL